MVWSVATWKCTFVPCCLFDNWYEFVIDLQLVIACVVEWCWQWIVGLITIWIIKLVMNSYCIMAMVLNELSIVGAPAKLHQEDAQMTFFHWSKVWVIKIHVYTIFALIHYWKILCLPKRLKFDDLGRCNERCKDKFFQIGWNRFTLLFWYQRILLSCNYVE